MKLSTAILLSRSRTAADRSRIRLATMAVGLSGALLISALRVGRLGPGDLSKAKYSNYLAEEGLRPGVIAAFVVIAVLAAGLAGQALRIGVAARERRLNAVRLAGGSVRQVKQLGAVDAGLAGLVGGLLAAPIYLFLSLLFGAVPRMGRLLPGIDAVDLPAWVACTAVTTLAAATLGWSLATDRRSPEPVPSAGLRRPAVIVGTVLMSIVLLVGTAAIGFVAVVLVMPFLIVVLAPHWAVRLGQRLTRSKSPANVLAGARLITDSRPTGRLGGVLVSCALLIGFLGNSATGLVLDPPPVSDTVEPGFYLTGFFLGMIGLLLIVATAFTALLVGVTDQLVDQRRQLACLTAFGVDARFLRRVIERQLIIAACPTLGVGLFLGCLLGLGPTRNALSDAGFPALLLGSLALAAVGVAAGLLGTNLAGFLLRNHVQDALAPENLRAA
ncbi:hypothetical protein AB0P21_14420 [Kribbella sp. NPDC056861]|uniref:hypothetical protein n=1 Tax=Kribbella sp. NPDC056861 TaxID=3154857 RepID=UPI00342B6AA3